MPTKQVPSKEPPFYTYEGSRTEEWVCSRCGSSLDVAAIKRVTPSGRGGVVVAICARCMAALMDMATGWNVSAQVERWYAFGAAGRMLAEASHRSPKRKEATQERVSAQERRKGGTW